MRTASRLLSLAQTKKNHPATEQPGQGRAQQAGPAPEQLRAAPPKPIAPSSTKLLDCSDDVIWRIATHAGATGAFSLMGANHRCFDAITAPTAGGTGSLNPRPAPSPRLADAPIWRNVHGTAVPHVDSYGAAQWHTLVSQKETIEATSLPSYWFDLTASERRCPAQQATALRNALKLVGLRQYQDALVLFGHAGATLRSAEAQAGLVQALANMGRHAEAEYFHSTPLPQLQQAYERLGAAWQKGVPAVFELMRQSAVNVSQQHGTGTTALHVAATGGEKQAVSELLVSGADPTARDAAGDTPLHLALRGSKLWAAQLLIAVTPADLVNGEGQTLLHAAAQAAHPETVDWFCKHHTPDTVHAWLLARDAKGDTPLHLSFLANSKNARTLLELGADINARNTDEYTALGQHLRRRDKADSALVALAFEPRWRMDFNATDSRRNTLLHDLLAESPNHLEDVVLPLLRRNKKLKDADIRVPNARGQTPLSLMGQLYQRTSLAKTLRAAGRWNHDRPPHLSIEEHKTILSLMMNANC